MVVEEEKEEVVEEEEKLKKKLVFPPAKPHVSSEKGFEQKEPSLQTQGRPGEEPPSSLKTQHLQASLWTEQLTGTSIQLCSVKQ